MIMHQRALMWSCTTLTLTLGAMAPVRLVAQEPGAPYAVAVGTSARYASAVENSRRLVHEFMVARGIPGLSIAVGVNGDIVWSEGFGYANVESRTPVTTLSKFRSGSDAKPITAAALAVLYEQGRIDLDAPIQRYVPRFPTTGGKHRITPRMLAGHLSGMRHYPPNGNEFFSGTRYTNVLDGLAIFQDDPLLFEPGTRYSYSSYGTNLLGMAIQGAVGKDYLSVVRETVFEPLGMRHTFADYSDSLVSDRVSYYERTGQPKSYHLRQSSWGDGKTLGTLLNAPFADNSSKFPSGGYLTTPEDLVRFGSAYLKPGFLKAETLKLWTTSQRTASGQETGYGFNWMIGKDGAGRRTVAHGGSSVGGTSYLITYPDQGVVLAVQVNLTDATYRDFPTRVAQLFLNSVPGASPAR